jgi:AcrR family transcriptional regulator
MKRKYELKKRAEAQAETGRRIVEAAIQLHCTKGPARTTVSDVASLAGVQRATVYSHFPSERELGLACSGLYSERNPAPDPSTWLELRGDERLQRGLTELYQFFDRNQAMISCVVADSERDELTRELFELRLGERLGEIRSALAEALPSGGKKALAALDLALSFATWQQLSRSGLSNAAAADVMVRALLAQDQRATVRR